MMSPAGALAIIMTGSSDNASNKNIRNKKHCMLSSDSHHQTLPISVARAIIIMRNHKREYSNGSKKLAIVTLFVTTDGGSQKVDRSRPHNYGHDKQVMIVNDIVPCSFKKIQENHT